jgi:hypothetical protein
MTLEWWRRYNAAKLYATHMASKGRGMLARKEADWLACAARNQRILAFKGRPSPLRHFAMRSTLAISISRSNA